MGHWTKPHAQLYPMQLQSLFNQSFGFVSFTLSIKIHLVLEQNNPCQQPPGLTVEDIFDSPMRVQVYRSKIWIGGSHRIEEIYFMHREIF